MTPKTPKRFGAYHRISKLNGRDLADETTMTDKVAFEQMDAWATMRRLPKPDRYLDADVSGSKLSRPELDRMLDDLRAGVIDGIVVAQVDRLSRADVGDALAVVKQILDVAPHGLVILDLGIDPSTEFGEFGLTILLGLSRMQWRRYQRQWSTSQTRAVEERGAWIGPSPLGYLKSVVGHTKAGKPIHGPLELDPATWRIVRDAFRLAATDDLYAAMALLKDKLPAKTWRKSDVRRVLRNRAYLGEHHGDGAAHPAIVDFDTWTEAQTAPRARRSNGDYVLSGIASCQCGAPLVGALQSVHGRTYRRYRCSAPACRGGSSISAEKLETYIRSQLAAKLGDRRFRISLAPVGLDDARDALSLAETERKRYAVDLAAREALGDDAWLAGARARTAAVEAAQEAYQLIAGQSARSEVLPAASELDDDEQLLRAVRAAVVSISVRPGRGDVADRVGLVLVGDDLDDRAAMLAA